MSKKKKADVVVPAAQHVPVGRLTPHPQNYRGHPEDQIEHIMTSIRENGFYRNVVAAKDGTILAGHGVVEASKRLGLEEVPAILLDIDPGSTQAKKILAGDNTLSMFAEDDDRFLADLLKELKVEDALGGTGFDELMLANLVMVTRPADEIADKNEAAEWAGMPEFEPEASRIQLVINFETRAARDAFIEDHEIVVIKKMRDTWSTRWPTRVRDDLASVMWQEDGEEPGA